MRGRRSVTNRADAFRWLWVIGRFRHDPSFRLWLRASISSGVETRSSVISATFISHIEGIFIFTFSKINIDGKRLGWGCEHRGSHVCVFMSGNERR